MTDHIPQCPFGRLGGTHSDAARRISDTWNLHRVADMHNANGKWFAARLEDGSTDGQIYDSKRDAIRHQRLGEKFYAFICISVAQMNVCDAEIYLSIQRRLYDKGIRMTDPDARNGGRDVIKRSAREDMLKLAWTGNGSNLYIPGRN